MKPRLNLTKHTRYIQNPSDKSPDAATLHSQNQISVSTSVKMVFLKTFIFILCSVNKSKPCFGTPHTDPRSFACFYKYSHQQFRLSLSSPADYVEIAGLISLSAFLTESSPSWLRQITLTWLGPPAALLFFNLQHSASVAPVPHHSAAFFFWPQLNGNSLYQSSSAGTVLFQRWLSIGSGN